MTNALVIHPYLKGSENLEFSSRSPESRLDEVVTLSHAIDLNICHSALVPLRRIDPATILTSGKCEEIFDLIKLHTVKLLIVDCPVTPVQQRNLEKKLKVKVLDRIGLILEIFGKRAATREGKLQVQLAQLSYQKSRLVKAWSHLERQRGGGGFTGGPGETQKEADRRMIDDAIKRIEKQLEKVVKTRTLHRQARKKVPYPIIALAGYTNAGKSTLFNRLTDSDVLEADMLFATLDPTLRTISLPSKDKIILSDTVGFISDLPTQLVKAFRATLEEVTQADMILHVRDIAHKDTKIQKHDVLNVLRDVGVLENIPIIEIFNKTDLLTATTDGPEYLQSYFLENEANDITTIKCSALTGDGIIDVKNAIQNFLDIAKTYHDITLNASDGAALAALYNYGNIIQRTDHEDGTITVKVFINKKDLGYFQKTFPLLKF